MIIFFIQELKEKNLHFYGGFEFECLKICSDVYFHLQLQELSLEKKV